MNNFLQKLFVISFLLLSSFSLYSQEQLEGIHQRMSEEMRIGMHEKSAKRLVDKPTIPLEAKSTNALGKIVFGFLPDWEYNSGAHANMHYDLLSHIAVYDFKIQSDGSMTNPSSWPWTDVINGAHAAGTKVIMSVSNASVSNAELHTILSGTTSAKNDFFNNVKSIINTNNLDGVNIDFENFDTADRGATINAFMSDLSTFIHTELPGKEVSFDGPAINWSGWDFNNLIDAVDYLFIMAYDYNVDKTSVADPVAPLFPGNGDKCINKTINDSATGYADAVAKSPGKIILGVPYYGRKWQTTTEDLYSNTVTDHGNTLYKDYYNDYNTYGRQFDTNSHTPWYKYQIGTDWYEVYADDEQSLSEKYDYINNNNFGGVGIWALNFDGDRPELWNLINEKFDASTCVMTATSTDTYFVRYVKFTEGPWNARVQLLLNETANDRGYADYRTQVLNVSAGNSYSFMGRGKSGIDNTVDPSYWKVWIDYNNDGKFDGANEEVLAKTGDDYAYQDFTIPTSIPSGDYTLRVATSSEPITFTCGHINAGEIEDYTVNVENPLGCMLASSTDTYYVRYILFREIDNTEILNNVTANDGGYGDYKAQIINTVAGSQYRFMGRGKYGIDNSVDPSYWKVWIDYNNDGKFDGPNEEILAKEGDAYAFQNFTIPSTIPGGDYVLRVATSSEPITFTCGMINEGEIEDYTIRIADAPDCMTATSTADYFVRYILFRNIDNDQLLENVTAADGGYGDYKNQVINTVYGGEYRFMGRGKSGIDNTVNPSYWKVWIDYNNDGRFDGADEEILAKEGDAYAFQNFTVPFSTPVGDYILRVATSSQPITFTCGHINAGEIEDYTIRVEEPQDCMAATSTADYFVRYILFRDIDNNQLLENITTADGGYGDYKDQIITTYTGKEYRFMGRGKSGIDNTVNPSYWKVWIDYNNDGRFDGANEEIVSKLNDSYAFFNFTIPSDIAEGDYVLRVATSSEEIQTCGAIAEGEIEDYTIRIFAPTLCTWVGTSGNGTWNDANNWNPRKPQSSADKIIVEISGAGSQPPLLTDVAPFSYAGLTISVNNEMKIDQGGSITITDDGIQNNGTLTVGVSGNLESNDVSNDGTFVIESTSSGTGSVKTTGTVTKTASATYEVQRWIDDSDADVVSGNDNNWCLVSSPVSDEEYGAFTGHTLNSYNVGVGSFSAESNATIKFDIGKGYVARYKGTATNSVSSIVFNNGVLNTGDKTITLTTGDGNTYFDLPTNFNLIGNPYPSYLNWDKVLYSNSNANNITPFLYYYVDNGSGSGTTDNTNDGSGANGWAAYEAQDPAGGGYTLSDNAIISNGQGFGVVLKGTPSSNSITIPNSARTHERGNGFRKKNSDNTVHNSFELIAKSHGVVDKSRFNFNVNATSNYDEMYDAYKFNSFGDSPVISFVTDDNKKLSICRTSESSEFVNLGFKMDKSEEVTFSVEGVNDFTELILEDKVENKFTDLTKGEYTFAHNSDDSELGRFVLHLNKETLSNTDDISDNLNCFVSNNTLYIKSSTKLTDARVNIYNISGVKVQQAEYSELQDEELDLTLSSGIYLIELTSNEGVTTIKISL